METESRLLTLCLLSVGSRITFSARTLWRMLSRRTAVSGPPPSVRNQPSCC